MRALIEQLLRADFVVIDELGFAPLDDVGMLDRLLHHAVVVVTDWESFRLKDARTRGGLAMNVIEHPESSRSFSERRAGACRRI
ncbi:MAG: hypothetical protein ACYC33_08080 [Thermoleophilia bacterium]